jgi:hypothetical protein
MEKYLVAAVVAEFMTLDNRNLPEYFKLAEGLYVLPSDSAVNPSLRQRYRSFDRRDTRVIIMNETHDYCPGRVGH